MVHTHSARTDADTQALVKFELQTILLTRCSQESALLPTLARTDWAGNRTIPTVARVSNTVVFVAIHLNNSGKPVDTSKQPTKPTPARSLTHPVSLYEFWGTSKREGKLVWGGG